MILQHLKYLLAYCPFFFLTTGRRKENRPPLLCHLFVKESKSSPPAMDFYGPPIGTTKFSFGSAARSSATPARSSPAPSQMPGFAQPSGGRAATPSAAEVKLTGTVRVAFDCEFSLGDELPSGKKSEGTLLAVGWRATMSSPLDPGQDVVISHGLHVYVSVQSDRTAGAIPPQDRSERGWAAVASARGWSRSAWDFWKKELVALNSLYDSVPGTIFHETQESLAAACNADVAMWEAATTSQRGQNPPVFNWAPLNAALRKRHGAPLFGVLAQPNDLRFEFDTSSSDINWMNKLLERYGYKTLGFKRDGTYASNARVVNVSTLLTGATASGGGLTRKLINEIRENYRPTSTTLGMGPVRGGSAVAHNPLLDTERIQSYGNYARRFGEASLALSTYTWNFKQGITTAYPEQAEQTLDELMPLLMAAKAAQKGVAVKPRPTASATAAAAAAPRSLPRVSAATPARADWESYASSMAPRARTEQRERVFKLPENSAAFPPRTSTVTQPRSDRPSFSLTTTAATPPQTRAEWLGRTSAASDVLPTIPGGYDFAEYDDNPGLGYFDAPEDSDDE
jgi:hypothetical protein